MKNNSLRVAVTVVVLLISTASALAQTSKGFLVGNIVDADTLPGVVDPGPLAGGFVQGNEFSVNGLRARANNQLIDGLDNNDNSIAGQSYIPALREGYSEVTVLQSDYSAEFGRAGGAVVNIIKRSGTNSFHGSVYDVVNNSSFNSLTASQRADGTRKPVVVENTFGFSLGGPIKKDKLFFFGTYQGDRFRAGTDATARVPTAAGLDRKSVV